MAASAAKLDLVPNRNLLDAKFESYRLSLEPLPIIRQSFQGGVQKVHLEDDQYGYLHVQMSGFINALVVDPWDANTLFFMSEAHHVMWTHFSHGSNLLQPKVVWKTPESSGACRTGTLDFPHAEWCLISDGMGTIYILTSPSRPQGEPWQLCYTHRLEWGHPGTILLTSAHSNFPSSQQMECLLAYISRPQDVQGSVSIPETTVHFVCVLEWLTFTCMSSGEGDLWSVKRHRRLVGASIPKYVSFDTHGSALCLASEKSYSFVYDSCKAEVGHEVEETKGGKSPEPPLYYFIQTAEDIRVFFRLNEASPKQPKAKIDGKTITVAIDGETLLSGEFPHAVKSDSSFSAQGDRFEIRLLKAERGVVWHEVVVGDSRGEEVIDPAFVEEIHARLAHLTSENEVFNQMCSALLPESFACQALVGGSEKPSFNYQELDECDSTTEYFTFTRLCGDSHRATHQINLSGHQWLFSVRSSADLMPALCLRHDVDGLVWQPRNVMADGDADSFRVEHVATFNAFGYVQASKQDRKFVAASPDFSFVAVCNAVRHVYLYRQPETIGNSQELRNRRTGREVSTVAKQHVISLEQCDGILGMVTNRRCIFVLSPTALYAVKVPSS